MLGDDTGRISHDELFSCTTARLEKRLSAAREGIHHCAPAGRSWYENHIRCIEGELNRRKKAGEEVRALTLDALHNRLTYLQRLEETHEGLSPARTWWVEQYEAEIDRREVYHLVPVTDRFKRLTDEELEFWDKYYLRKLDMTDDHAWRKRWKQRRKDVQREISIRRQAKGRVTRGKNSNFVEVARIGGQRKPSEQIGLHHWAEYPARGGTIIRAGQVPEYVIPKARVEHVGREALEKLNKKPLSGIIKKGVPVYLGEPGTPDRKVAGYLMEDVQLFNDKLDEHIFMDWDKIPPVTLDFKIDNPELISLITGGFVNHYSIDLPKYPLTRRALKNRYGLDIGITDVTIEVRENIDALSAELAALNVPHSISVTPASTRGDSPRRTLNVSLTKDGFKTLLGKLL